MTEDQLQEHGYPRSNPEAPGRAILYNLPEKKPASDRESPHSIKHTMIGVLLLHWLCSQLSTKYAADVAQNTRSTPMATVCGKRNVAFTGDSYVDIKVWVFFFCFNSNPVVNRFLMLISTNSTSPCSCPIVAGGWETSYRCCAAAVGAPGCQVSKVGYPHPRICCQL